MKPVKEYTIEIRATAARVWYALWDDAHYRLWTRAFMEGSYAKTDEWKTGSRVHFLGPEGRGMYSDVTENTPNETMIFTHLGEVMHFEEQPLTEQTRAWAGSQERYYLSEKDGRTTLQVKLDVVEAFEDYFDKTFPLALAYVKELAENFFIIVKTNVDAPLADVWAKWINPADIMQWNFAGDDWHCPMAANDLRAGAQFNYRMEAKDGSFGFDFGGVYTEIIPKELITYTMGDGRKVEIRFEGNEEQTTVTEKFEPENMNALDMQRMGWQMILNNFKKHAES